MLHSLTQKIEIITLYFLLPFNCVKTVVLFVPQTTRSKAHTQDSFAISPDLDFISYYHHLLTRLRGDEVLLSKTIIHGFDRN